MSPSRDQLIEFLSTPDSYTYRPESLKIVQTHASIVAIVPPLVFKVKKPVDFGFLDFSTLEQRRHFCEEEVRLNRRMCPFVYEGVIPITSDDGRLTFDGTGEVVEYAIQMKRLEPPYFLHRLIKRNQVDTGHIDRVVRKLVAFYGSQAPPDASVADWGRPENIRISTEENFDQIGKYRGRYLSRPAFRALRFHADSFLVSQTDRFNRRVAQGRILDCHGDLRLGHVHLGPGQVCIYDCIEFSERFRCIDVANDVAFLAMELDASGHPELAKHFTESMAHSLSDPDLLDMVDFYKTYRAVVRGKVEALRSEEMEILDEERAKSADRAKRHFSQALRYAIAGSQPLVIVIMGRVGTGKTTIAEALSENLDWKTFSSDRIRKELAGLPPFERPEPDVRRKLYTASRTNATYSVLTQQAVMRAKNLEGTVLDATYGSSARRTALRNTLDEAGVRYAFVELTAPRGTVEQRLQSRENGNRVVSDARVEDLSAIDKRFEEPAPDEPALLRIESDDDVETTVTHTLKNLVSLLIEQ